MKNSGFTLAEVLITLGIIGVVAAITMPTLIGNYKKVVYVNQLKKSVSSIEQGFKKLLADNEVEKLSDIPEWPKTYLLLDDGPTKENVEFVTFLKKYFKCEAVSSLHTMKYMSDKTAPFHGEYSINFSDGSMLAFPTYFYPGGGQLHIDINGFKAPNTYGRDIFVFYLSDSGNLFTKFPGDDEPEEIGSRDCVEPGNPGATTSNGIDCAARIMENGWVMDY